LVQKQLIKVQGASKKIFQNQENLDYYNWFVRYFVPQTEVSRIIANRDDAGIRVGVDGQIVGAEGQILEEERIDVNTTCPRRKHNTRFLCQNKRHPKVGK
jgi:hypothetical protein